jgi:hypothetical protein
LFGSAEVQPVSWSFEARRTSTKDGAVFFKASIGPGWRLYSLGRDAGGPLKTTIGFAPSESFALVGNVVEPNPKVKYDKYTDIKAGYFENAVVFQQNVTLKVEKPVVKGEIQFVVCNDQICLPPKKVEFSIQIE